MKFVVLPALAGAACLAAGLLLSPRLDAETFSLTTQAADGAVNALPAIDTVTGTSARIGLSNSDGFGRAAVLVFALPKMAFGERITSVTLNVDLLSLSGSGFTFNADLYSLGTSGTDAVLPSDYFNGAYGSDPKATALQSQFLTPSSATGHHTTSTAGSAALTANLNAQVAAGATAGSYYFLRLNPDFAQPANQVQGYNVSMTEDMAANRPTLTVQTAAPPQLGRVLWEYWTGLSTYGTLSDLTNTTTNPNYPNKPNAREYPTVLEIPNNMDTSSGDRMRCIFYPPTTGSYTLAIASDDSSSLLLSTDGTAAHATQVASVTGYTNYQDWTKYSTQQYTVTLTANQPYYMEALHKQGTLGSNVSIGWMPPGASALTLMPATYCAPYDPGVAYASGVIANTISRSHPRLMLSAAALQRLVNEVTSGQAQYNSTQAATWSAISYKTINTYLPEAVVNPQVPAVNSNYITPARELQDRVYYMAMYYLIESKINPSDSHLPTCLTRIYAELQSAAQWGSGNWASAQFLDLPEISHAFAIAYDWCYAGWTSAQLTYIRNAVATQALTPGINAYTSKQSYITGTGNWPIVCDGGLIFSALAILGDDTTQTQPGTLLNDLIPAFYSSTAMATWAPDGGWFEAPDYWAFAARYLTTTFACLETSGATCFALDSLPGMSSVGSFPIYYTGPNAWSYGFSDANDGSTYTTGPNYIPGLQYLGVKYNQPLYSYPQNTKGQYPTDMIWFDPRVVVPSAANAPLSENFRNSGILCLRSAWGNTKALFAGMKAGFNANVTPYGTGHEDLEIGGFVFDALGVRWAVDLGRDDYGLAGYFTTNPWSTSNRWLYYRKRAEGNNTLVINPSADGGQSVTGTATVTDFESTASLQQAVIDMTSAYATSSGNPSNQKTSTTPVTSAKRGLRISGGTMQLQDELTASAAVDFHWFMHTATTVSLSADKKTATLIPASGTARLQMTLQSPSNATFATMSAVPLGTSPNPSTQAVNTSVTKVWIHLPSITATTVAVAFQPYTQGGTVPAALPVATLNSWAGSQTAAVPENYNAWAASMFGASQLADPAVSGGSATPMQDGMANVLKYLCDINPTTAMSAASRAALPTVGTTVVNGVSYLTLTYRRNPLAGSLIVTLLSSPDLQNWTTVTPDLNQTLVADPVTGDPMIRLGIRAPATGNAFLRLNVAAQ